MNRIVDWDVREKVFSWAEELSLRLEDFAIAASDRLEDLRTEASLRLEEMAAALQEAGDRLAQLWERAKEALREASASLQERLEGVKEYLSTHGAAIGAAGAAVAATAWAGSNPELAQLAGQGLEAAWGHLRDFVAGLPTAGQELAQLAGQGLEAAWGHLRDFVAGLPTAGQELAEEMKALKGELAEEMKALKGELAEEMKALKGALTEAVGHLQERWENFKAIAQGLRELGVDGVADRLQEGAQNLWQELSKPASQVYLERAEEARQAVQEVVHKGMDIEPF